MFATRAKVGPFQQATTSPHVTANPSHNSKHEISREMATAPIAISRATSTNSNSAQQWPYLVSTVSYHTCEKGVFTESIDFNTYMKPSWIMVPWPGHIMHAWH